MTESTRNLAVGFFVVTSLIVLATLMAWFGETPDWLGSNEWTLEIVGTKELRGINQGSPVQLNGVEIGRVKDLRFDDAARPDRGVIVVTRIKDKYQIPQGATARLYGATLGFGGGRVEIIVDSTGDMEMLPKKDAKITGEMRSIIGEMISKDMIDAFQTTLTNIGSLAGEATPAARNFSLLLESRPVSVVNQPGSELTPNVSTVVERLDRFITNVDAVLGDPEIKGDLQGAIRDIKSATAQLRDTVELMRTQTQRTSDNLNTGIDQTKVDLDRNFDKLYRVLDNLDNSTQSLAFSMQQIAQGKGTLGLLANDPRLYEAAVLSAQRFGESMTTLNVVLDQIQREGLTFKSQSGLIQGKILEPETTEPPRR
jgi:ABC-type transporter Mla subunit MlaD